MTTFRDCPAECPDKDKAFDASCAARTYPQLATFVRSLELYVAGGLMPGAFLAGVLRNDLLETYRRGDPESLHLLPGIVDLVFQHMPAIAWGSREAVDAWRRRIISERTRSRAGAVEEP